MLYCNKDPEVLSDPYVMNESKLEDGIAALWPAGKLGKIHAYSSDMPGQFAKEKNEIPTRTSLSLVITYGIIFHTYMYYDNAYYTFSHSLHALQVNDFIKCVFSKRAL